MVLTVNNQLFAQFQDLHTKARNRVSEVASAPADCDEDDRTREHLNECERAISLQCERRRRASVE